MQISMNAIGLKRGVVTYSPRAVILEYSVYGASAAYLDNKTRSALGVLYQRSNFGVQNKRYILFITAVKGGENCVVEIQHSVGGWNPWERKVLCLRPEYI